MIIDSYSARMVLAGYRPATLRARRYTVEAFARHLAPHQLDEASRHHVETFLARPLAPESRRAYRSHLRAFYRWALDEGLVSEDPTARLPPIRVPRSSPRPIAGGDLASALAQADARMRAWLLLMALGGLRCIEVAALSPADVVEHDAGTLLFLRECKGGGTATVPAHPAILEALAVLPIRNGQWWDCDRVAISKQVAAFLRSAGVEATAHRLRHYAGTAWYRASGHDLLATATLLRHASVSTTQVYAQTDPTRPAEVVGLVNIA